jgi:hypothetical protein
MDNFASFENMSESKDIHLLLEWNTGGTSRTVIKPGEVAEIVFNDNTAIICHRSDGGDYTTCPNKMTTAKAEDYFQLEEDGGYTP